VKTGTRDVQAQYKPMQNLHCIHNIKYSEGGGGKKEGSVKENRSLATAKKESHHHVQEGLGVFPVP
jgi:hypothetical protein